MGPNPRTSKHVPAPRPLTACRAILVAMTPEQGAILASSIAALIGAVAAVASAIFAGVALRTQRRVQRPHVKVRHGTVIQFMGEAVAISRARHLVTHGS